MALPKEENSKTGKNKIITKLESLRLSFFNIFATKSFSTILRQYTSDQNDYKWFNLCVCFFRLWQ